MMVPKQGTLPTESGRDSDCGLEVVNRLVRRAEIERTRCSLFRRVELVVGKKEVSDLDLTPCLFLRVTEPLANLQRFFCLPHPFLAQFFQYISNLIVASRLASTRFPTAETKHASLYQRPSLGLQLYGSPSIFAFRLVSRRL